jgi:hypothetical protein
MKVRCTKLFAPDGSQQTSSPWLTVGRVYDVLTVELEPEGLWLIRLIADTGQVALFRLDAFEVVSNSLAPSWVARWTADGSFRLAPKAWLEAKFWERFHDREPDAMRVFDVELARLTAIS